MAAAARKKALVLSLTLTFSAEKVPERRKYGMSDWRIFESEKEEAEDFQPTKKCCTKLSAPKGKLHSKLMRNHCMEEYFEGGYVPKIPTTQWAISTYNGLCRVRSP